MNNEAREEVGDVELVADEEITLAGAQEKLKKLRDDAQQCRTERREYLDGWQRAKAELINYKKDEGRRREETAHFVRVGLIEDLLPILDSFDLALAGNAATEVERGIMLIRSQAEDILKKHGLETVAVMPGDMFRPEQHESIGEVESDVPVGAIAEVLQRGYMIRGRVLRPARVRLSK